MIIISPYSSKLRCQERNAKDYPNWPDVVNILNKDGFKTVQIGVNGEELIGASEVLFNQPLKALTALLKSCEAWTSVDNFLPHLAKHAGSKGVVIYGRSNPDYFGYKENINLIKDKKFFRPDQYRWWEDVAYDPTIFVGPDIVAKSIMQLVAENKRLAA